MSLVCNPESAPYLTEIGHFMFLLLSTQLVIIKKISRSWLLRSAGSEHLKNNDSSKSLQQIK